MRYSYSFITLLYRFVFSLIVLSIITACSSPITSPPKTLPPALEVTFDCERYAYPCTQAEVSDALHRENFTLIAELSKLSDENSTIETMVTWLKTQENIVQVQSSQFAVKFRIKGGRPVAFHLPSEISRTIDFPTSSTTINPDISESTLTTQETVGKDTTKDKKVNNKDDKKALFLSAFNWEFGEDLDSTLTSQEHLKLTKGYGPNNLKRLKNSEVDISAFRNWEAFDVVHVMSHGTYYCDDQNICNQDIATGIVLGPCQTSDSDTNSIQFDEMIKRIKEFYGKDSGVSYQCKTLKDDKEKISRFMFLALEGDWFLKTYPNGLNNKIAWFSTCQFFTKVENNSLTDSFATFLNKGINNIYLGWDESTDANVDKRAVDKFFYDLSINGLKTKKAYDGLTITETRSVFEDMKTGKTVVANLIRAGNLSNNLNTQAENDVIKDLRIREVVTLIDSNGVELKDGATLNVQGKLDDGKADTIDVSVKVDGIEVGEKAEFIVRFELDGTPIGSATNLANAKKVDDYSYQLNLNNIATNTSLSASKQYTLEAIVDLPEGGESRFEVQVRFLGGQCQVSINWAAVNGGIFPNGSASYRGGARADTTGEITLDLGDTSTDNRLADFFVRAGTTSMSASFSGSGSTGPILNQTGTFAPNSFGGFNFATTNPNDASKRVVGKSDSRNLGSLLITQYSDGLIKGSFAAEVFIQQFGRVQVTGSFEAPYNEDVIFQDVTRLTTICNGL